MSSSDTIISNLEALDFDNPSDVATFLLMAQGVGDFIDVILLEFTNTQNSMLNVINTQRYGKSGYYQSVALAYQDGDDLVPSVGTLDPTYAVIDSSKQIVKQAAFENNEGSLSLKVAAQNGVSGLLQPLTSAQLSDFNAYFVNFEIPGVPVTIVSLAPNIFNFNALCTFNAGYNFANLQSNIQVALNTFVSTFPFNGVLYADQLSDYVKATVPGVIDFYLVTTQIDGVPFVGNTILTAGYFNYASNILSQISYNAING